MARSSSSPSGIRSSARPKFGASRRTPFGADAFQAVGRSSLSALRRQFAAEPGRAFALVTAAWRSVVGEELARRTEPVGLQNGTLRVRVPDAAWRRTLHRMQPQLLPRLRELLVELAPVRLGFDEGELPLPRPTPVPSTAVFAPAPATPPAALLVAAQQIPDEELRQQFVASATGYLARGRD